MIVTERCWDLHRHRGEQEWWNRGFQRDIRTCWCGRHLELGDDFIVYTYIYTLFMVSIMLSSLALLWNCLKEEGREGGKKRIRKGRRQATPNLCDRYMGNHYILSSKFEFVKIFTWGCRWVCGEIGTELSRRESRKCRIAGKDVRSSLESAKLRQLSHRQERTWKNSQDGNLPLELVETDTRIPSGTGKDSVKTWWVMNRCREDTSRSLSLPIRDRGSQKDSQIRTLVGFKKMAQWGSYRHRYEQPLPEEGTALEKG